MDCEPATRIELTPKLELCRIPLLFSNAATTAVPSVLATRTAGWCVDIATEEAIGEKSASELIRRRGNNQGLCQLELAIEKTKMDPSMIYYAFV